MTDMINPDHYKGDRRFEPIEVIEDWGLNYRLGNALKYISRNGRKPNEDPREGLKKAIWYLEREITSLDAPTGSYFPDEDGLYDDVLRYYGETQDEKEAWPVDDPEDSPPSALKDVFKRCYSEVQDSDSLPFEVTDDDWIDFWDTQDNEFRLYSTDTSTFIEKKGDVLWDPSLGPVELSEEEISRILAKKALDQFEDDEIVSTIERRGLVIGVKKDGSTIILSEES